MSCGIGHRCGSGLMLLWLWHRLVAAAPVRPLAWEPPYAVGVALKIQKKTKNKKTTKKTKLQANIPMITDGKILSKICANPIQQNIKMIIHQDQMIFTTGVKGWWKIYKSV